MFPLQKVTNQVNEYCRENPENVVAILVSFGIPFEYREKQGYFKVRCPQCNHRASIRCEGVKNPNQHGLFWCCFREDTETKCHQKWHSSLLGFVRAYLACVKHESANVREVGTQLLSLIAEDTSPEDFVGLSSPIIRGSS